MKTERVEGASSGHHRRGITVVRSTMREGWLSEVSTAATVADRLVFKSLHLTNACSSGCPRCPGRRHGSSPSTRRPPLSPNQDQVQTHTLTLNTWDRGDENENEGVRRASTSNSNSEQQQQRATATASHRADKNLITHVHKQRRPTQPLHGQPLHNILKRQNTRRKQHHVRMLLTEIVHV